jgi:hypothetical protein
MTPNELAEILFLQTQDCLAEAPIDLQPLINLRELYDLCEQEANKDNNNVNTDTKRSDTRDRK